MAILLLAASTTTQAQNARYQGEANLGYGAGTGTVKANQFWVETVHGVRINPYFFVGAGLGLHLYSTKNSQGIRDDLRVIPFIANLKVYLSDRKVNPFVSFDAGYGITLAADKRSNGAYFSPALGLCIRSENFTPVSFSIGYQSQKLTTSRYMYDVSTTLGSVAFKLGFIF